MKKVSAICALCVFSAALAATPNPVLPAQASATQDNPCNRSDTLSLEACGSKAQAQAEQTLKKTFQRALTSSEPAEQQELRQVERVWLQYRNTECKLEAHEYGTLKLAIMESCIAEHDKIRIAELKDIYLK